jgi:hypothetical protein
LTTLHEELAEILRAAGNRWMSLGELAGAVNARGRYVKRDGSVILASQINLRTRAGGSYEWLFERDGKRVRLKVGDAAVSRTVEREGRQRRAIAPSVAQTEARVALAPPAVPVADAIVPDAPGLYAIYGDKQAWSELGLGESPDTRPLYVGKAEDSLLGRDMNQHLGDGRTGSSTLRRSLAALLRERLQLHGIPRNPTKPADFDRFGLQPSEDRKLTDWMRSRLAIATWCPDATIVLRAEERELVSTWLPPLNLQGVRTPWSSQLLAARRIMADEARRWSPPA